MYKTYIMHYKPATERYDSIISQVKYANIENYELITDYDKEDLNDEIIKQYYNPDKEYQAGASSFSTRGEGPIDYRELKAPEISLCVKYMKTFEKILNEQEEYFLFLEDDCVFNKIAPIETIIESAPKDFDAIFIGGAFDVNIVKIIDIFSGFVLAGHPATNTTSSFILTKTAISKMLEYCVPFCLHIDWQLNYAFSKADLKVYHTIPYICKQVSGTQFNSNVTR